MPAHARSDEHGRLRRPVPGSVAAVLLLALSGPSYAGEPPPKPESVPEAKEGKPEAKAPLAAQVEQSGRVPLTIFRLIAPTNDPEMAKLLKTFEVQPAAFDWKMKLQSRAETYTVHTVTFPSPVATPIESNNTVHCEYFVSGLGGRRPAVVVLHILDGRFIVERLLCASLADAGIHALLLKMPYYGPRRPPDWKGQMTDDPEVLATGLHQAVMDVRRAAVWLSSRADVDPNAVNLCGVSLGGFVAATTAGVDGRFPRVVVILAGGDLMKVFENRSREVKGIWEGAKKKGWDAAALKNALHPVEPLVYAARLKNTKVLMLNGENDEVVPPECSERLAEASGARAEWYPATHYTMALYLPLLLEEVIGHLSAGETPR